MSNFLYHVLAVMLQDASRGTWRKGYFCCKKKLPTYLLEKIFWADFANEGFSGSKRSFTSYQSAVSEFLIYRQTHILLFLYNEQWMFRTDSRKGYRWKKSGRLGSYHGGKRGGGV